jgi:pSer/pThr/pTyr-binding forkhead associated (FHA) protein
MKKEYNLIAPIKVGRKADNHLCYPEDLHLSNSHAEIYMTEHVFYLEDRASTNGYATLACNHV